MCVCVCLSLGVNFRDSALKTWSTFVPDATDVRDLVNIHARGGVEGGGSRAEQLRHHFEEGFFVERFLEPFPGGGGGSLDARRGVAREDGA